MKKQDFLIILYISLFVAIVWIITDFIHSRPQAPLKPNLSELLSPLNPNFNQTVIDEVNKLPAVPTSTLSNVSIEPVPTTTPNPTNAPIVAPTPQATQSGAIQQSIATDTAILF